MQTKRLEKILKPLASRRRLDILKILKQEGVLPVGVLAGKIKLSFKATSKHLLELYRADLVDFDKHATENHYYIAPQKARLIKYIIAML